MRSLYVSLTLAMLVTLSLALGAFGLISGYMDRTYIVPVFEAMDQLELDSARAALTRGGKPALDAYMAGLDRQFGTGHYLAGADGRDIVSGRDLSAYLPPPPADRSRGFIGARFVVTRKSADGGYWFVSAGPQKEQQSPSRLYALVAIAMAVLLSLAAALFLIRPLRQLTGAVQRFGRGDLAARAPSRRRDEIGLLARAFNDMADRIARLVTGERRLLQDISHELRSPLARLKLAVRLARTAPDRDAALDRIERDVDRIAALTGELVETARLEGEVQALQRETMALGQLIGEAVEDCYMAPPHDIRCAVAPDGAIVCDPALLRRAVENVLRNAIRHAPPDRPVEITAQCRAGEARIAIRDHGPGVPDDALERIFAPFYRVDEARDAASGGLGLGLAIARSAVERHGGTITARNAHPGLCVEIVLPAGT